MVLYNTTLVPSLGLRIGPACEAGLSTGMQRERVPPQIRKKGSREGGRKEGRKERRKEGRKEETKKKQSKKQRKKTKICTNTTVESDILSAALNAQLDCWWSVLNSNFNSFMQEEDQFATVLVRRRESRLQILYVSELKLHSYKQKKENFNTVHYYRFLSQNLSTKNAIQTRHCFGSSIVWNSWI